jgi:hypothetical protein
VVRLTTHAFVFVCARDAVRAASNTATTANEKPAATQLLDRHQGRNDNASEAGSTASKVDTQ